MDSTTQKIKVKNSLLMHFKTVKGSDGFVNSCPSPVNAGTDPVLSYLAVADKDGVVWPVMWSSMLGAAEELEEKCGSRRRKWRLIRAALNGTTLMRMVIKRRKSNKEKLSWTVPISNLEETSGKISNPECKSTCRTSSNVSLTYGCNSSALTSSSPSSSNISLVRTVSTHETFSPLNGTKQKQCGLEVEDRKKGQDYGSNYIAPFCMLSIALLVLILWGKIVAIVITSMSLYLVPCGHRKPCNEGGLCRKSEFESVQNKKVLIMEAVLGSERSHNCF